MEAIANLFAGIMTIPVFVPFAVFAVVFVTLHWRKKSRKEAITLSVNVTTFFLITAVAMMYNLVKERHHHSSNLVDCVVFYSHWKHDWLASIQNKGTDRSS